MITLPDDVIWYCALHFLPADGTLAVRLVARRFERCSVDAFGVVSLLCALRRAYGDAVRFWNDDLLDPRSWPRHAPALRFLGEAPDLAATKRLGWEVTHHKSLSGRGLSQGRLSVCVKERDAISMLVSRVLCRRRR